MDARRVTLVDTSILMRMIGIDGDELATEVAREIDRRTEAGEQFVIPVTAIVETGNRIAQQASDRRRFTERLKTILETANAPNPPWIVRDVKFDQQFVDELLAGNSTGSNLVDLIGDRRMGTGDVALLVERDQFKRQTAYVDVGVWSLDGELSAYG